MMVHGPTPPVKEGNNAAPLVRALTSVWNGLLDIVYPPRCLVCGTFDTPTVCSVCLASFQAIQPPVCALCGRPDTIADCPDCRAADVFGGFGFTAARSAARYEGPLALAIQRMKYNQVDLLGEPLGDCLTERLLSGQIFEPAVLSRIQLVIPVPLHPRRLRQRGFNQATLLARPVARGLGVPIREQGLRRAISTRQQANLSASERRENMARDVFVVNRKANVAKMGILLIDDVMTTGSTLSAGAAVLRAAGASEVYGLTLAVGV